MLKFIISTICLLISLPLIAAPSYSGESGYKQLVQCSAWIDIAVELVNTINNYVETTDELMNEINSIERKQQALEEKMSNAEYWMSIQEAAGDINGYNRNADKYNNAGVQIMRNQDKQNKLVNRFNKYNNRRDNRIDDHSATIDNLNEFCGPNKSWSSSLVKKACSVYDKSTASYCKRFK